MVEPLQQANPRWRAAIVDAPGEWARFRDKGVDFCALDDDIERWLGSPFLDGFVCVGADRTRGDDGRYIQVPYSFALGEWRRSRGDPDRPRVTIWLRHPAVTPHWSPSPGDDIELACSYSGFIGLQHGLRVKEHYLDYSRIICTTVVVHQETNLKVHHAEYEKTFDRLKRLVRSDLVVSTQFPGDSDRLSRGPGMTAAAAAAHRAGAVEFLARPREKRIRG